MMGTIRYRAILSLLFFTFLSVFPVFSQFLPVDSLEAVLASHTRMDTAKVNLLNKLGFEIYVHDAEKAKLYAEQSQKLAEQLNYPEGKATGLWLVGLTYYKNNKQLALNYYNQALHIAEQVNDQAGICQYLLAIGNVTKALGDIPTSDQSFGRALLIASTLKDKTMYTKLLYSISRNLSGKGQYSEAIEKLQQVADIASEIGDNLMLSRAYSMMAIIFNRQGNSPQAMEYYLSALHIDEQQNDQQGIFSNLINMATIQAEQKEFQIALENIDRAYQLAKKLNAPDRIAACLTSKGNIYLQMKHPDALRCFQEALQMTQAISVSQRIQLLVNIGSIYIEQEKFNEAEENLNEALDMAQKAEIKFAYSDVLKMLGNLYFAQKEYARAIDYTNRALQLGNEIKYLELKKDCYKLLADIYAVTGDYKEAYFNYTNFKQLNDSVFNEKNVRKIAFLESAYKHDKEKQKYEMEKTTQQLKIKNQHYLILFLIAVTFLVLILLYQVYLSNRLKKKALRLEIEKINSQLEYSQKEMTSATLQLVQSSESDAYCMKILKSIENNTNEEGEKNIRTLISYYKNKSVYSNWDEFETLFLKVNSGFYDKLNEHFPTLTLNERKLCVFLKLNMTNKDIAQITFQSEEALKKARMRLRKKLELDRDENLAAFILNF